MNKIKTLKDLFDNLEKYHPSSVEDIDEQYRKVDFKNVRIIGAHLWYGDIEQPEKITAFRIWTKEHIYVPTWCSTCNCRHIRLFLRHPFTTALQDPTFEQFNFEEEKNANKIATLKDLLNNVSLYDSNLASDIDAQYLSLEKNETKILAAHLWREDSEYPERITAFRAWTRKNIYNSFWCGYGNKIQLNINIRDPFETHLKTPTFEQFILEE